MNQNVEKLLYIYRLRCGCWVTPYVAFELPKPLCEKSLCQEPLYQDKCFCSEVWDQVVPKSKLRLGLVAPSQKWRPFLGTRTRLGLVPSMGSNLGWDQWLHGSVPTQTLLGLCSCQLHLELRWSGPTRFGAPWFLRTHFGAGFELAMFRDTTLVSSRFEVSSDVHQ